MTIIRNRANWVAGWMLASGLFVMATWVMDPLNAMRDPNNDMGFNGRGFTVVLVCVFVSCLGLRLFSVPFVASEGGILIVRNPVREWRIPKRLVEGFDDSLTYLRVHAGGRKIICVGLEKSNFGLFSNDVKMDERLSDLLGLGDPGSVPSRQSTADSTDVVSWAWVRVQRSEQALLVLWSMYAVVGALQR